MDQKTESLRWKQIYRERLWMRDDVRIHAVRQPLEYVAGWFTHGIVTGIKLKMERGF